MVLKELILTLSTFGGCGGLQRIIFNSFYIGRVWWFERTHFQQFLLWEGVVVLKELILTVSTFGWVWWS